jgi:hypothetical protein
MTLIFELFARTTNKVGWKEYKLGVSPYIEKYEHDLGSSAGDVLRSAWTDESLLASGEGAYSRVLI